MFNFKMNIEGQVLIYYILNFMKTRLSVLFIAVLIIILPSKAQTYTELTGTNLEGVSYSAVATGDLNNDGYLDVVISGLDDTSRVTTRIYINNYDGSFRKLDIPGLTGLYHPAITIGDYNDDGNLDILFAGEGFEPTSALWKNNGDLTFTKVESNLESFGETNAELRDINNDGALDVLISGFMRHPEGYYSDEVRMYLNAGNNLFNKINLVLSPYSGATFGTLGDFDNDGDLDLIIGGSHVEIYPNQGNGEFYGYMDLGIHLASGSIKWFDYNNDGLSDFLIAGRRFEVDDIRTEVYTNSGDELAHFNLLENTPFVGLAHPYIAVRDNNNDGKVDVLLSGTQDLYNFEFAARVYTNLGDTFEENASAVLPQSDIDASAWFDMDNDGDLDIILTQDLVPEERPSKILVMRNNGGSNIFRPNTVPSPPTDIQLSYNPVNGVVDFTWNAGSDPETNANALSYNIGIGTSALRMDILNPESDLHTGRRKIVRPGNCDNSRQKSIRRLKKGTYYFVVQSIDGSLAGSPFSEPQKIAIGIPDDPSNVSALINNNGEIELSWRDNSVNEFQFVIEQKSDTESDFTEIGTTTSDSTKFLIQMMPGGTYTFRIKAVNPNGESAYVESKEYIIAENKDIMGLTSVYPNPADQFITIENYGALVESAFVELFNINGQKMGIPVQDMGNMLILDVSRLSRGRYILRYNSNGQFITRKLIVR